MEVPSALMSSPNWVLWKYAGKDNRKIPIQVSGEPAKSNDPTTWVDYHTATECQNGAGLGYVFDGSGIFGIDLDGCIDKNGIVQQWAKNILEKFPSYAEISPSGSGIKIFALGTLPGSGKKKTLDIPKCCDKAPAIEVYGRGRYFTVTFRSIGRVIELVDCQQALDDLLRHLSQPIPTTPTPAIASSPPIIATPAMERAKLYLERFPPAIQGQGGDKHTFRACCVLCQGFSLSPDEAWGAIQEWNQSCNPPWEEKALRRNLERAASQPGQRGYLLEGRGYEGTDIELSELLRSLSPEEAAQVVTNDNRNIWPKPDVEGGEYVERMRPPGLISEIIDYNLSIAMYPQPVMALAGAITLMAVITGRRIRDRRNTRTNLYFIVLSPSGSGKNKSREVNKAILGAAGCEMMDGGDDFRSHAGFIAELDHYPSKLFQPDEFQSVMSAVSNGKHRSHLQHVPEVLKQCYSETGGNWKPSSYGDRSKNVQIVQPHAVLHASGVPAPFWDSMSVEMAASGFLGRTIVVETGFDIVMPQDSDFSPPPDSIIKQVEWWKGFDGGSNLWTTNPSPITLLETQEAHDRLFQHLQEIRQKQCTENYVTGALWGRSGQKAAQLALVFAASRQTGMLEQKIELQDVDMGIALANWSTRLLVMRCESNVAESDHHRRIQKILSSIGRDWTSKSQITRDTQRLCERQARDNILYDLVESQRVEKRIRTTGGRACDEFRLLSQTTRERTCERSVKEGRAD